ncbi:MAG TPA: IS481 family transposase [Polyangiales bacterium]|nr:IS481 family transposase [Polyangiales bacterium]
MDVHKNARLTLHCRVLLVRRARQGQKLTQIAQELGVSLTTVRKWLTRHRAEGDLGLQDRSCRPQRSPSATVKELELAVLALRRQRLTLAMIAAQLKLSRSTVARICARAGLQRLCKLDPVVHYPRYERAEPGELLHLDVKKLGRIVKVGHRITGDRHDCHQGAGWEYVHIAIDDASRVAYSQVLSDEEGHSTSAFLQAAVAYYAGLGVRVREVLTDNGVSYRGKLFKATVTQLGLKHRFTRPYTPRTNGKAERFIQSALREWAYARAYRRSEHRTYELARWLHGYNWHRPHASLAGQPPISRIGLKRNNLVRLHS